VPAIPVIALTGYLGAGKTSLLNHVLQAPGARIGVVINDFGEINVDAALVTGQVDEPVSIAGGCVCCLPDDGGLDEALEKLTDPRLALDVIIVEASGLADPAGQTVTKPGAAALVAVRLSTTAATPVFGTDPTPAIFRFTTEPAPGLSPW